MLAIACILLFPVLFVMGKAALKILYGAAKRDGLCWEDEVLTGAILLIGLAEAAHLKEVVLGRSVSASAVFFFVLTASALSVSAVILLAGYLRGRGKNGKDVLSGERIRFRSALENMEKEEIPMLVCLGILALVQICIAASGASLYLRSDMTLETVEGFLKTDRIYEYDPMTGLPYQRGMPSRLKILCLPTLYAALCRLLHADPELLVWHLTPLFVLLLSYLAYGALAKSLFPASRRHREMFLAIALLLFFAGDYMYGTEGFGLLHGGFQGVSIRGAVLLPYLLSLCIRKKWRLAWGPVLAEACIVWTLYGLGLGVLLLVILAAPDALRRICGKREGGAKCTSS